MFKNAGVQALFLTNFFSNVIRLVSNLILARFLGPEAFAITGLAVTVIFALNMLSDGGFKPFILRHERGEDEELLSTLWTIKLLRNIVLAIILYLSSDSIAAFFEIAELSLVLKVLCINLILEGIKPLTDLLAERQNKVAVVMYLHFGCYVLSTMIALLGVYFYQTYWFIVVGMIFNLLFMVIGVYLFLGSQGTSVVINKQVASEFFGYAKFIMPSSTITLLLIQLDKIILGKSLSVEELGLYYVAFNFSSAVMVLVIQYAKQVLYPYMTTVYRQAPETYASQYYDFRVKISMLLALGIGLLSAGSYIFFDVLYDETYIAASFFLSLLLMSPLFALISYPSEVTLLVYGKLKITLIANVIRLIWFIVAAPLGYHFLGVLGLLIALGLMELMPILYMCYKMHKINLLKVHKEFLIILAGGIGFLLGYGLDLLYRT